MKISISLNRPPRRYAGSLGAVLWLTGVTLMTTAVILFLNYMALKGDYPHRVEQLNRVLAELNDSATTSELPRESDLRLMRDRVQALNKRVALRGIGTIRLLDWLEANMPDNTYLLEFYHKQAEGDVVLVIAATNTNEFTQFLNKFERESWFSEALLNKNENSRNEYADHVQYELRIRLQ